MVLCVSCGEDNPEGTHYCINCGVELGYAHVPTPRPEIVIDDVPPPDDVAQRVHEAAGQPLGAEVDPLAGPAGVEVDARNEPALDRRGQPAARPPAQPTTSPARPPRPGPDPDPRAPRERPEPDSRRPPAR